MNLYSHYPYWLMKDGMVASYTSLDKDIKADVAIMGAGISGALCAYYLRNSGLSVVVLDRRHVGMGSTAASTAFLQYEIDTPMNELARRMGETDAVRCYELCRKAIYDVGSICKHLKPAFDFHIRPSLQYASFKKHRQELYDEYQLRHKHGFDVDWLEPEDLQKIFGLEAPGAIFSKDGGEVDAYLLTHALLRACNDLGHKVYDNTHVSGIVHGKKGIVLSTDKGYQVKAGKLIIACGYESQNYLDRRVAEVYSTYALVSEPVTERSLWHKNSLIWETADPYLYFRIVSGNRILIGGKDDRFHDPEVRDGRVKRKAAMLVHAFSQRMKNIAVKPDFSWAGAFAVTKDGLPYIGQLAGKPHTWFALGYGGNGITFSAIAAEIIRDGILNKNNRHTDLFGFNR